MLEKIPLTGRCLGRRENTPIGWVIGLNSTLARVKYGIAQRFDPADGWVRDFSVLKYLGHDYEDWDWLSTPGSRETHIGQIFDANDEYSREHGLYEQLGLALKLALTAHWGQKDKGGMPYIMHVIHVADRCFTDSEKCVALLHDVIEDAHMSAESLREMGIADWVIDAVVTLTRKSNETYDEYITRVGKEKIPRVVKIEDLKHNIDIKRIKRPVQRDYDRIKMYKNALEYLESIEYR